jgi:hypothetical protein
MSTAQAAGRSRSNSTATDRGNPDAVRLRKLRELAAVNPARAKADAWEWLRELQKPSEHKRLDWMFAQGTAPEAPDGDCEGIVMNLYGELWLTALDRLVRLGQLLGGIGWAGKSFDAKAGTGFNRLTGSSRPFAFLTLPRYKFERVNGELIGFHFYHSIEKSPIAPFGQVRSIRYDAPEHANPLVMPRTRDELVEIVPDVFLGRAALREKNGFKVVGYFGLRYPVGG